MHLGLALLLALALPQERSRLWYVEFDVQGPLRDIELVQEGAGRTRLEDGIFAGERRHLRVPVPARLPLGPSGSVALPGVTFEGAGTLEGLAWSPDQPAQRAARRLAPLLRRPRPAPALTSDARLSTVALGGLFGVLLAVLAARSRPGLALGLSAAGTGLVLAFARPAEPASGTGVLELEEGLGSALQVRVSEGEVEVAGAPATLVDLQVEPPGAPLEFSYGARTGRLRASAPGARLFTLAEEDPPNLGWKGNGLGSLARVWTRDGAGAWLFHGAWEAGTPLPTGVAEGDPPPGWLASGLPPGRAVLLGERAGGGDSGPWFRLIGP